MQIVEIEWLKKNSDLLTDEDRESLNNAGVFDFMKKGEINLPLPKAVEVFELIADIVGRYMEGEQ
jgi:hypothetical protein